MTPNWFIALARETDSLAFRYYNKAVSLLLNSLKRGERHTNGTILAILQLATIEVSVSTIFEY